MFGTVIDRKRFKSVETLFALAGLKVLQATEQNPTDYSTKH